MQTLEELLKTKEGRQKIAASMYQPIRCGGLEYAEDSEGNTIPMYRAGGRLWNPEEWRDLKIKMNPECKDQEMANYEEDKIFYKQLSDKLKV